MQIPHSNNGFTLAEGAWGSVTDFPPSSINYHIDQIFRELTFSLYFSAATGKFTATHAYLHPRPALHSALASVDNQVPLPEKLKSVREPDYQPLNLTQVFGNVHLCQVDP